MERRTFVRLSAYTAAILSMPFISSCSSKEDGIAAPLFFSHITDIKTIEEAGADYRKKFPAEDNSEALTRILLAGNSSASEEEIQSILNRQVKHDFRLGKTVTVGGWVLSVTEARQCALYSILNS